MGTTLDERDPLIHPDYTSRDPSPRRQDDYGSVTTSRCQELDTPILLRPRKLGRATAFILLACVTCTSLLNSLLNGHVIVTIPQIARDLGIPNNLMLWPASINSLTSGCTLLICGSIVDVLGSRRIYLIGTVLQFAISLKCGLSGSGTELLVFRGLSGFAASLCLPSAVSLINSALPKGRMRSAAFACMGGGQSGGFAIGLVLGGVSSDTIGWRWGFHIAAIVNFAVIVMAAWKLPKNAMNSPSPSWKRLGVEIDWVGGVLISTSLALLFYVLAIVGEETSDSVRPLSLGLSAASGILLLTFIHWVGRQERHSRPALIRNSIWLNKVFTNICISVFLVWGSYNALEQFLNLFFQELQHLGGLDTALRFLPSCFSGMAAFLFVGLFVHRIRADVIIFGAVAISAVAALLSALMQPSWAYWACGFPAMILGPIAADTMFTISVLLISSVFPQNMQGLAGGVFNTIANLGNGIGLALAASIANSFTLTPKERAGGASEHEALLVGYRAAFWFCLAFLLLALVVCVGGLRNIGMVGHEDGDGEDEDGFKANGDEGSLYNETASV